MSVSRCNNLMDFRRLARRRLPAPMFHYIDGGADDEWSLRNNTEAFNRYELLPSQLRESYLGTRFDNGARGSFWATQAAIEVEGRSVRLGWSPTSGPVAGYGVFVARNGAGFGAMPESMAGRVDSSQAWTTSARNPLPGLLLSSRHSSPRSP